MDFSKRKMTRESAMNLKRCPVDSVSPYALALCPMYIWMNRNQKFLSVKSPLDFFTPEELDKFKSFQNFYVPPFVDSVLPFLSAAQSLRAILKWMPRSDIDQSKVGDEKRRVSYPQVNLPPASFEISDAVVRIIGKLWEEELKIEPFFIAAFVNEFCEAIPKEKLIATRDQNIDTFEIAILRSSLFVFLSLHLGKTDYTYLNQIREEVFDLSVSELSSQKAFKKAFGNERSELYQIVRDFIPNSQVQWLSGKNFGKRSERIAHKLASRVDRVLSNQKPGQAPNVSIFGPMGFADD